MFFCKNSQKLSFCCFICMEILTTYWIFIWNVKLQWIIQSLVIFKHKSFINNSSWVVSVISLKGKFWKNLHSTTCRYTSIGWGGLEHHEDQQYTAAWRCGWIIISYSFNFKHLKKLFKWQVDLTARQKVDVNQYIICWITSRILSKHITSHNKSAQ